MSERLTQGWNDKPTFPETKANSQIIAFAANDRLKDGSKFLCREHQPSHSLRANLPASRTS
jgi:hypothetical protein